MVISFIPSSGLFPPKFGPGFPALEPIRSPATGVLHLSTILASFILRTFLVSYSGVLENLGKAFKHAYAKPLRVHSVAGRRDNPLSRHSPPYPCVFGGG